MTVPDQTPEPLSDINPFDAPIRLEESDGPWTDAQLCDLIDNRAGHILDGKEVMALAEDLLDARARNVRALSLIHHLMRSRRHWQDLAQHMQSFGANMQRIAAGNADAYKRLRADHETAKQVAAWFAAERDQLRADHAEEMAEVKVWRTLYRNRLDELEAERDQLRTDMCQARNGVAGRDKRIWRLQNIAAMAVGLPTDDDYTEVAIRQEVWDRVASIGAKLGTETGTQPASAQQPEPDDTAAEGLHSLTIYGASDDLIEVEGYINEEYPAHRVHGLVTLVVTAPDGARVWITPEFDAEPLRGVGEGWALAVRHAGYWPHPVQLGARPDRDTDPAVILTVPEGTTVAVWEPEEAVSVDV